MFQLLTVAYAIVLVTWIFTMGNLVAVTLTGYSFFDCPVYRIVWNFNVILIFFSIKW